MTEKTLRIFVSSPSDVGPERGRVKLVADRLNAELRGRVTLEILRWEDAFYTAAHSFQAAIDGAIGNMAATDLVLCVVWKRAGLKLNPAVWRRDDGSAYESGTVLEFETAVQVSRERTGIPDVYLFRKTADVLLRADRATEEMEQYQLLQSVWRRWTESPEGYNTAGYQTFIDVDDFEQKLEICLRQWLERRGVIAKGPVWDRTIKGSPFCGLSAFDQTHATVFFGRETAITRATTKLRHTPFLLLLGASGSGKSSLMRAGLLPRVTAPGVIENVDLWRAAIVTPSGDPLAQLADALFVDEALGAELRAGDFNSPQLLTDLFGGSVSAAIAPIRAALGRAAQMRKEALHYDAPQPTRLFIAVDQVERLFVEANPDQVHALAALLKGLVQADLASVVAALRSDAYGQFQAVAPFLALLNEQGATFDVLAPSRTELEDIVTRPVAACYPPLTYEADGKGRSLAELLVADAKGGDALPLLQMTLLRLFDAEARRRDGVLRFADYPGMAVAVTRTAEEAVADLDERALAALPLLFTAFVRDVVLAADGSLAALTIMPVTRNDFERGDKARVALIDEFVARRLLTAEEVDGAVRVRPVHEALLRVMPLAVATIKENAALIRMRNMLEPMVAEWSHTSPAAKGDYLATAPAVIAGAAQLDARFGDDLPAEMRAFIADSVKADVRRREWERSRQRRILAATAAGLVAALILAGLAGWQWQVAKTQRQRAENALVAATKTANTLVFEMAQEFRNRGLPVDVVRKILDRARNLQEQLTKSGELTPALLNSEAAALCELSTTMRDQGDLKEALEVAQACLAIMERLTAADLNNIQWRRQLSAGHTAVGDVIKDMGRRQDAIDAYRKALAIREALAAGEPSNVSLQSDLVTTYQRIGDLLASSSQRQQALDYFQKSVAINERLLVDHPANSDVRQSLSLSYNKVGDIYYTDGRREDALAAYRKGLDVMEGLAADEPDNTLWQRHLATSHSNVGDTLAVGGRLGEALEAYRHCLDLREKLAASDPGNAAWQSDLAAAYSSLADVLLKLGQSNEAVANYQKSLSINEKLAARDLNNARRQYDLSVSENKIGDMLAAAGKWSEALAEYSKALEIRKRLANADLGNAERQGNLAFSYNRVASALAGLKRTEEALTSFHTAIDIVQKLIEADPKNAELQHTLSVNLSRVAALLVAVGRPQEALDNYRKDLAIAQTLVAADPRNPLRLRDLWASHYTIAGVLADLKQREEARVAYKESLAALQKAAELDPAVVRWQLDLVVNHYKLKELDDEPTVHLTEALAILKRLEAEGRLPDNRKAWIAAFEQWLKSYQN